MSNMDVILMFCSCFGQLLVLFKTNLNCVRCHALYVFVSFVTGGTNVITVHLQLNVSANGNNLHRSVRIKLVVNVTPPVGQH